MPFYEWNATEKFFTRDGRPIAKGSIPCVSAPSAHAQFISALLDCENQKVPEILRVVFNDPATIVLWKDGTKTVVKCQDGDTYSKEQGLALCIAKKALGNKGNFNNVFKEWCE